MKSFENKKQIKRSLTIFPKETGRLKNKKYAKTKSEIRELQSELKSGILNIHNLTFEK